MAEQRLGENWEHGSATPSRKYDHQKTPTQLHRFVTCVISHIPISLMSESIPDYQTFFSSQCSLVITCSLEQEL